MSFFQDSSLAQSTVDLYDTRLKRWIPLLPVQSIDFLVLHPKQSLKLLITHLKQSEKDTERKRCTFTNLKNFIAAVVAVLRYSPHVMPTLPKRIDFYQLWLQLLDQANQPMKDRRLKQTPTEQQSQCGGSRLTYQDLLRKRDSMMETDRLSSSFLLLAMYTYLYPVRADYYALQVVRDLEEPSVPNYIRIHSDHIELVLRHFKTSRYYKQIRYEAIPAELEVILRQSLDVCPRQYVFETSRGIPYTRLRFSEWASGTLQKLFGVELNLTMIRHLFISSLSMETPAVELKKISDLMGHSLGEQRLYKWYPTDPSLSSESEDESEDDHKSDP